MPYYLIESAEVGANTGIVAWKGHATNPEQAALKLADKVLDDRVQEHRFPSHTKVSLAELACAYAPDDTQENKHEWRVHPIGLDEHGDPQTYKTEDLKFADD